MPRSLTAAFNRAAARQPRDADLYLMRALINGDTTTAMDMISQGADVNYRNKLDETPLMAAALKGNYLIISMLLQRGADVNAVDAQGNTALHWLARAEWTREIPGLAQLMIDNGADTGFMNDKGDTAEHMAAQLGKERLARLLRNGIPGVQPRNEAPAEAIEIQKPIRFKTAAQKPEPVAEVVPEPVAEKPAPPPVKVEKSDTISEMEKRYAKAGLFG